VPLGVGSTRRLPWGMKRQGPARTLVDAHHVSPDESAVPLGELVDHGGGCYLGVGVEDPLSTRGEGC